MGLRRAFALLILTAAVIAEAAPSQARMPADLKLREAAASKQVVLPKTNPHERNDWCSSCHPGRKMNNPPGPSLVKEEFLNDDYPDELCLECHKGWIELHPTDIDPRTSRFKVSVPQNIMPLRYIYEGHYKIVCMTCHDTHFPHTGYKLLRGYSLNPTSSPARFADRLAFCRSCHGDQMEYFSPHKVRSRQTGCTLCHVRKPTEGRQQPLRANVNALCSYCHPVYPEPHYLHVNPFPEMDQKSIWNSGVPLRDGTYTCLTCHLPHGSTKFPAYLREEFVALTRMTVGINPHVKGVFCQSCHTDPLMTRNSASPSPALLDKNVDDLCLRCHASGKIKNMRHYLGPLTARVKAPSNLPLSRDKKIVCITCHLPGCGPTTEENPDFLRVNSSTGQLCASCHDRAQLSRRDIHEEFRQDRGCDVCHERTLARGDDPAKKPGELKADQNFVCLQCHEPVPHPGDHPHTVKPGEYEYVQMETKVFPMDEYRRITCYSCHQTNRKTKGDFFLRGSGGGGASVCRYCHPY